MVIKTWSLGLRGKVALSLTALLLAALFTTSFVSYQQSKSLAEQKVIALEKNKFSLLKHEIDIELQNLRSNLQSLRDIPAVNAMAKANLESGSQNNDLNVLQTRLESIFVAFLRHHTPYFQIRYINAQGQELIRVERGDNNQLTVAAIEQLQNKSDSTYVKETLKLHSGQSYISDVTLNREHGIIQHPFVPVLRIGTPVIEDEKLLGMIVINLYAERLFSHVRSTADGVRHHVVNEKGDYIKHTDPEKTFALDRGTHFRLHNDEADFVRLAKRQDQLIRHHAAHGELDGFSKIYFSAEDPQRFWLLTMHVPEEVILADVNESLKYNLILNLLIGVLAMVLIILFITKTVLLPIITLSSAARQLHDGDLSVRVATANMRDEFYPLATGINAFAKSQQKNTEQFVHAIDAQTKRLSAVIDNVIDGIITINEQGMIESFNPAACAIFGYDVDEVIGKNVNMLMPEPYRSEHDGYLAHHRKTGEKKVIGIGREVTGLRKNGSTFPMDLAVSRLSIDDELHFVGIVRDISERIKQNEDNQRLIDILELTPDFVGIADSDGKPIMLNRSLRHFMGFETDDDIYTSKVPDYFDHETTHFILDEAIPTAIKNGYWMGETLWHAPDGRTIPTLHTLIPHYTASGELAYISTIARDITERKQSEQMQKEFISTVSHELRTPLTSIRGSLGLILGGITGELPEKAKTLLTIANNNSERLIHLINDILDIEKISAGKMQFDYHITNLVPLLEHAIEANRGYADQLNVALKLDLDGETALMIRLDEKRMAQVMSNLLSNAAKYSPPDAQVEVSLRRMDEHVRIAVHDHGKGIPDEFKRRIFSRFAQADSSDTRQKGGTGLGLSITKAIVEHHGGSIDFSSSTDAGTTFFVDLPLWQERRNEQPIAIPDEERRRPLVLVIEDDQDISKLLSLMLQKDGYRIHHAFAYEEALTCLQKYHYSAITLDLTIPGGSGLELLNIIRKRQDKRGLPVIVVSAATNEGKLKFGNEADNIADWLEKPIDEQKLLDSVKHGIAQAKEINDILHVEDDPDIALVVDSILGSRYKVSHADSLKAARTALKKQCFDLVLLDIGLPDGSGLELLQWLNDKDHRIPVIIFSAQDVSADIAMQVSGVLVKSATDNEKLVQQINTALRITGEK